MQRKSRHEGDGLDKRIKLQAWAGWGRRVGPRADVGDLGAVTLSSGGSGSRRSRPLMLAKGTGWIGGCPAGCPSAAQRDHPPFAIGGAMERRRSNDPLCLSPIMLIAMAARPKTRGLPLA